MNKKLVIFDFDGVLVNTSDLGYSLHLEVNPGFTRERYNDFSNGNFIENVKKAIVEEGFKINDGWNHMYNEKLLELPTHDVIDLLVKRMAELHVLVIVSSSESQYIRGFLEKHSLTGCFDDVLGCDVAVSKVVKMHSVLERHGLSPKDAIFITDTLGDVRDGTTCGVACIGVTWGNHDRETLEKGSPHAIVDTVPELEDAIEKFFVIQ